MHGYLKLVRVESDILLYRNNTLDYFNATRSVGDPGNEILYSSVPQDKFDRLASLKGSFRTHGYNAFWFDDDRCFFIDNSGETKIVRVSSGLISPCSIDQEAHGVYDFPQDGNFLGRSERFIFWAQDSTLFWRSPGGGAIDSVKCPKYVKKLIGVIGMSDGKVAIFASGKNPSFFSGHPGWSGVLSFDFAGRSFNRVE